MAASSFPDLLRLASFMAPLLCAAALAAEPQAITFNGGSMELDTIARRMVLRPMEIRQGAMTIRADEATINGLEVSFSNTEWRFRGAVHITFEGGELDASEATVKFSTNRLHSARVTGTPATFSHPGKDGEATRRGRAAVIDYDAEQSRVVLNGDVWFTDGKGDFTTRGALTYDLSNRSLTSPERVQYSTQSDAIQKALKKVQP